jgi:hypothetical protein
MLSKGIVKLNNALLRLRSPKVRPEEVLILIPSCLQASECDRRVRADVGECRRCGRCGVGEVLNIADELGVGAACATGGRLALSLVRSDAVKAVIAVACEKELRAGIIGAFPKPVIAVANIRPNGPCKDTRVNADAVRKAVESVLRRTRHAR